MGLFIKKIHGDEYVYAVVGKAHYFLGRKDGPGEMNQQKLRKAVEAADRNFDHRLGKYLEDMLAYAGSMPDEEGARYVAARVAELEDALRGCGRRVEGKGG